MKHLINVLPVDWLMQGSPFLRYKLVTDLLDTPINSAEAKRLRKALDSDPLINQIFGMRNADGYWGDPRDIRTWWPKKNTTFWVLGILADFGLTRNDRRLSEVCEYVFSTQLTSGAFGWGPPPTPGECFTGILAEALAKLGCANDPRLEKAYSWLLQRQRLDGGFWCKNTGQPGKPREKEPSCAYASLCVLAAFMNHPVYERSKEANKCATFLLKCWDNRGKIKYAGHDSQIGKGWDKLKYPFTDYRILYYLDTLSRIEECSADQRIEDMVEVLINKMNEEGKVYAESVHKVWSSFDFGQKIQPSRWITFLVYRIIKRIMLNCSSKIPSK
ncbi:terpene cyclase/mutase family protein [bacterium]|nr:terpene cyclase/mutase family protein [bacterium]